MAERQIAQDRVIDIGEHLMVFRKEWWKAALFSIGVGLLTFFVMLLLQNVYQATAVIAPVIDEKKPIPALGALASFGINVGGGASKVEDLENLFRSNDLTVRVFQKHDLWSILFKGKYDPATGIIRESWLSRFFRFGKGPKRPDDWDAIRAAKKRLKIFPNKRSGTLSMSFETPSPEGSATILKYYLEEGKSRLQEEALERAEKNKKFIQEQIGKTLDALTRERFFTLYGQEVEREMMARNREQFGFQVIDSPRAPDRKSGPHRGLIALLAAVLAFLVFCVLLAPRWRQHTP